MKLPVSTSFVDAKGVADFSPGLSRFGDTLGQVGNASSFVDANGVADFSPGLSRFGDTLGQVWDLTADPNGVTEIAQVA